jgi:hypothetical protein
MRRLALARYAPILSAAVLFAGCGAALDPGGGSNPVLQSERFEPRGSDLLYASSIYSCDVYVLTYPGGTHVQTINACGLGFGPAFGLCTDRGGDVFMAMGEGFTIFEFAHGGTKPIAQLQADGLLPVGCSVDPQTGDLGVASAESNVAVYKNASGAPQIYWLSSVSAFFFCTYDDRGNLFVAGEHDDRSFALAELPEGGGALREIKISENIGTGFGIQWDGRHLAIGATQGSNEFTLDRIRVSGSVAKVIGMTTLSAPPNTFTPFQFWIGGRTVIQPESRNSEIGFWSYPGGGNPTKGIQIPGSTLSGVTVSTLPRR